eukprot:TRINITY_DN5317_c0_g1_i1.p1 TRINITY_DN5317_c0_g1~~TRINITY_DN5317_c0_g1_i1.p1  ORF type:complete len:404 (-),score=78.52 TRINITY_DN5317_c0_g1_i1:858-2069(-)
MKKIYPETIPSLLHITKKEPSVSITGNYEFWKMNQIQTFQTDNNTRLLFRCFSTKMVVIQQDTQETIFEVPIPDEDSVNCIQVKRCCGIPICVMLFDSSLVRVYFVDDFDRVPIQFHHHESPWGCDVALEKPWIAVSANSFDVTIYDLSAVSIVGSAVILKGHEHNVPNVYFLPGCSRFVLSVSIDQSAIVWDVERNEIVARHRFSNWLWGGCWIPKDSVVKCFSCDTHLKYNIPSDLVREPYVPPPIDMDIKKNEHKGAKYERMAQFPFLGLSGSSQNVDLDDFVVFISSRGSFYVWEITKDILHDANFVFDYHGLTEMKRFSFVQYLPEFSAVIAANQGLSALWLIDVKENISEGIYQLDVKYITGTNEFLIVGMDCIKEEDGYSIYFNNEVLSVAYNESN